MKVLLSQIADIFSGVSTAGRSPVGNGQHELPIINVKDLIDGEIETADLNTIFVEAPSKVQRYLVRKDDVILTTRGTLLKAAVVPERLEGCLVSSNLAVIRLLCDAPISPTLLQAFLESPLGQQSAFSRSRVTTLQLALTVRDLAEIEIPILEHGKSQALESLFIATKEYVRLEKSLLEGRIKVSRQLLSEAFTAL